MAISRAVIKVKEQAGKLSVDVSVIHGGPSRIGQAVDVMVQALIDEFLEEFGESQPEPAAPADAK